MWLSLMIKMGARVVGSLTLLLAPASYKLPIIKINLSLEQELAQTLV